MNRLTRLIGRDCLMQAFIAPIIGLFVFAGAMTAHGQSNPFVPIGDEVQALLDVTHVTGGLSNYPRAYFDRWNIPGGIQLQINFNTGFPSPDDDLARIAMLRGFPPSTAEDSFDGVKWSFLSDTPIIVKLFALSWDSNFYEGNQPSSGCGVGAICVPANVPTTISLALNEVTPPLFPTGDYSANVASVGFQIFGAVPPQDGTSVPSMVSVTSLASSIYQWEYIDPTSPNLGKRKSSTLTTDGYRFQFRHGIGSDSKDFTNAYLANADISHSSLESTNFTNAYLAHTNFSHTPIASSNFTDADLSNADLSYSGGGRFANARNFFTRANLSGANLTGGSFTDAFNYANLAGANLSGTDMTGAIFDSSNITLAQLYSTANYQSGLLQRISLAHVDLSGANFANKTLVGMNFTNANLSSANLAGAYIEGSTFEGSHLTPAQLISTRSFQNGNLSGVGLQGVDLSDIDFSNKNLSSTRLWSTNLSRARLNNADLSNATLYGANLDGADLTGVQGANVYFNGSNITFAQLASTAIFQQDGGLSRIGLSNTNLAGANFAGKNLFDSDLSGANLSGADLSNAHFESTKLVGANLSNAAVRGTSFYSSSLSLAQLVSTADYRASDLTGVNLGNINLAGANFAGQNLTDAGFLWATITGANFSGAKVRGTNFESSGITAAQLALTASYLARDLTGIHLGGNNLSGANFVGQNLAEATFRGATLNNSNFSQADLTHADFLAANLSGVNLSNANLSDANLGGVIFTGINLSGANIRGANLSRIVGTTGGCGPKHNGAPCHTTPFTLGTGITPAQIAATASYQSRDLSDVQLQNNNLNGAILVAFNLTNTAFDGTTLVNANLSGADVRGAAGLDLTGAITANLIGTDGHVSGFNLNAGFFFRDYDGNPTNNTDPISITVDNSFAMGPSATVRYFFEADAWNSTISFAAGIPVNRGGKLDLLFATGTNLASQVGRTFKLFDWTGVTPTGTFNVVSPYSWNLSNLYTTGEVTLMAVPEPAGIMLVAVTFIGLLYRRRRQFGRPSRQMAELQFIESRPRACGSWPATEASLAD